MISECKDVRLTDMPTGSETHELLLSSHAPLECDIYSAERSTNYKELNYKELNGRQKIFETSTLEGVKLSLPKELQ